MLSQLPAFLRPTQSAVNLAIVRIIGCSAALLWSRPDRLIAGATVDAPRVPPTVTGDVLLSLPRSDAVIAAAAIGLNAALVCGLVGWRTRPALLIASIGTWYVVGLNQSFGKVDHDHHLLWVLIILAASPCADALSLDARRKERPPDHPAYGFPVRMIWLVIGLAYFSAGLWKVGSLGADWVFSDNLRNILWNERLARGGYEPLIDIAGSPFLYRTGAAFAVAFELAFVFLVFTRARPVVVAAGVLFHMTTWATMGIGFLSLVALYGVFFDWTAVSQSFGEAWRRLWASGHRAKDAAATAPRSTALTLTVPLALAFLIATAGATRELNGWPVASYPDFGHRTGDRQVMLSIVADGQPVTLAGLSPIEQHRLLQRAWSHEPALAQLREAVEGGVLCDRRRNETTIAIRLHSYRVTDSGLRRTQDPQELLVTACGGENDG